MMKSSTDRVVREHQRKKTATYQKKYQNKWRKMDVPGQAGSMSDVFSEQTTQRPASE